MVVERPPFLMVMEILLVLMLLAVLVTCGLSAWLSYKNNNNIVALHKRIDSIFTVDIPTPNEATQKEEKPIDLSEQNMLNIPPDVKFQIEADDNVPPGFKTV